MNTALQNRLYNYKAKAEQHNQKYPNHKKQTWKDVRSCNKTWFLKSSTLTRSEDGTKIFVNNPDDFPSCDIEDAHEIVRLDHKGWYTDNFQNERLVGAVVTIRTGHKVDEDGAHFQYMPATHHSDWNGSDWNGDTIYNEFYDSKDDAAWAADHYAEQNAAAAREDDAKYQAEQDINNLRAELHELNKETLALIKDVKRQGSIFPETVCELIKDTIQKAVDHRTEIFEEIAKLIDDPWHAVTGF